jgi:peptide/nickel transport system substrate-binding protein
MAEKSSPMHQQHSRRRFLQIAGATGFVVTATGNNYAVAQTPVAIESFTQSPVFDAQDLPPVAERVSEMPLVVQPRDSIGQYGGIWRSGLVGGNDTAWLARCVGYTNLVSWSPDWSEVVPNVAHAFESSEDGRHFTFHLRPGMKWSDGEPFSAADIEFYVNNIYRNPELTSSLGNNPFTVDVADDLTFTVSYEQPNGFALKDMCLPDADEWLRYPRHYLEQFHIEFNPNGIDALVAENEADNWVHLFQIKGSGIPGTPYSALWSNPELPRLHPWLLVEPYGDGNRVFLERNPYY